MATAKSYRSVWRWHSYAGLAVLPFLLWLAVTGASYLYKPEIERAVYGDWTRVAAGGRTLPIAALAERVGEATGRRVTQVVKPVDPGASWRMTVASPDGTKRTAFVDPHDGRVLGTTAHGGVMGTVKNLHSLAIAGPIGEALIEIVAGWTIILVATGLYLWWPRSGNRALALRGSPKGRLFWRDLHASTGFVAGGVVLFLATTGMPWSGVWGEALQGQVAAHGLGRPEAPGPSPWEAGKDGAHGGHGAGHGLPWSMERAAAPRGGADRIGPDRALAAARARGVQGGWTLTFPAAPDAPYLVSAAIVRAEDAHVVYVDAGTGAVLQDARYAEFGAGARAIEWGVAAHQGQQYGEANRLVMLAGCVAAALLSISAPVMWWRRRPSRRTGAAPERAGRGVLAIMLAAGALFPLTGLTMVLAWVAERALGAARGIGRGGSLPWTGGGAKRAA